MAMGGGNSNNGGGLLLVSCIFTVALFLLTTQPQAVAAIGRHASTPEAQFLQAICNKTVSEREHVVEHCYSTLVDQAKTFNGSHIKVLGAAVSYMVKHFVMSVSELTKFKSTPSGAKYNLAPCIGLFEEGVRDAGGEKMKTPAVPAVAKLKSLEAAGDDKISQQDLDALDKWLDKYDAGYKRVCGRDEIYKNDPNAETIADISIPTLGLNGLDVGVCLHLVKNYYAPKQTKSP